MKMTINFKVVMKVRTETIIIKLDSYLDITMDVLYHVDIANSKFECPFY